MIIDRDAVLVPVGVTTEQWIARYGIEPFTHPCARCRKSSTTTIPFAQGPRRGLMAPQCLCGYPTPPYCIIRATGDLFDECRDD